MSDDTRRLPKTYEVQMACANCKHCFIRTEHDCGPSYYCTLNAPPRPLAFSVAMGEIGNTHDEMEAIYAAWDEWGRGREVEPHGYCDDYDPREHK